MRTSAKPSQLKSPIAQHAPAFPDGRNPLRAKPAEPSPPLAASKAREVQVGPEARSAVNYVALAGVGKSVRVGIGCIR